MNNLKEQIKFAEQLVDLYIDNLNEQMFSPSMEVARIKGKANVDWTGCFDRRCNQTKDKFARAICKEVCKRESAQDALGQTMRLVALCKESRYPRACAETLRKSIDAWNNRIRRIDDRIADLKRQMAEYRANIARR